MRKLVSFVIALFLVAIAIPQDYMPNRRKAFQPSGVAWTPASISGLKFWFNPTALDALGYTEGSYVSNWNDLSGNNWYVTNKTSGQWPTITNTFNGKPLKALYFTGASGFMLWVSNTTALEVLKNAENCTLLGVFRCNDSSYSKYIFHLNANTSSGRGRAALGASSAEASLIAWTVFDNVSTTTYTCGDADMNARILQADFLYTNRTEVTGGTINVYTNGVLAGSTTCTPTNIQDTACYRITLGGEYDSTRSFAGEIAEVLMYVPAISSADKALLTAYLKSKYGTP